MRGRAALGFTMQPQHLGSGCVSWIAPPHAVHFLVPGPVGNAPASVATIQLQRHPVFGKVTVGPSDSGQAVRNLL